jgi:hypothetical protein
MAERCRILLAGASMSAAPGIPLITVTKNMPDDRKTNASRFRSGSPRYGADEGSSRELIDTRFLLPILLQLRRAVLAAILSIARIRMHALAVALMMLCANLLSRAVGPPPDRAVQRSPSPDLGDVSIRYAMLMIIVCIVATSLTLFGAARLHSGDVARARTAG